MKITTGCQALDDLLGGILSFRLLLFAILITLPKEFWFKFLQNDWQVELKPRPSQRLLGNSGEKQSPAL